MQTVFPSGIAYGQIEETPTEKVVAKSSPLLNTELIVRSYFEDIPVMIQIARCESGFRHTLKDGSVLRGVVDPADTGVMQINKRFHDNTATTLNLDLDDIYNNMAYARYLYEREGTRPWNASAPCWNSESLAMNNI